MLIRSLIQLPWLVPVLFIALIAGSVLIALILWWAGRGRRGVNAFRRGEKAYDAGDFFEAIEHLDYALKCSSRDPSFYCVRAMARVKLEEYDLAMKDVEAAFSVFPNFFLAYNVCANIHAIQGNIDAAFEDFRQAIKMMPDDFRSFLDRGALHISRGNFETALEDISEAMEINPNHAMAHQKLGEVLYYLNEYPEGIKHLKIAIQLDPDTSGDAYYFMGLISLVEHEYQKAYEEFSHSLEFLPNQADALIARANCSMIQGRSTSALRDFSNAIRLDPKSGAAWFGRGQHHYCLGNYSLGIEDLDRARELLPEDSRILVLQGIAFMELEDYLNGRSKLEEALSMNLPDMKPVGDYVQALYFRSVAYRHLQFYQESLETIDEMLETDSNFWMAYDERSLLRSSCPDPAFRDGKSAIEDALKSCELTRWTNSRMISTLACAYAESGEFKEAVTWIEKSLGMGDYFTKRHGKMAELIRRGKPYRFPTLS